LPFRLSVWMAGFEPAWSGFRRRWMKPGSPTSRNIRLVALANEKGQGSGDTWPARASPRKGVRCHRRSGYTGSAEAGWPATAAPVVHLQRELA